MAVQSPSSLPPGRSSLIDPSRQAEYPILLGQTFAQNQSACEKLLSIRYNWKSKQLSQRQTITSFGPDTGSFKLEAQEDAIESYKYSGSIDPKTSRSDSACLALVFHKDKSAFVLESVSQSMNFNLKSATAKINIDQIPKLDTTTQSDGDVSANEVDDELRDGVIDALDARNPYDFRHYLAEVKKDAETGTSSPKPPPASIESPGGPTSKKLTTSKSTNVLQSPFMGPSQKKETQKKSHASLKKRHATYRAPGLHAEADVGIGKRGEGGSSARQEPSFNKRQEAVSESVAGIERGQGVSKGQNTTPMANIIVDEASDLTIELGSPPPAAKSKYKINPDAFSNNFGVSSRANTISVSPRGEVVADHGESEGRHDMETGNRDDGDDHIITEIDDDDVSEDLSLPPPQTTRVQRNSVSRMSQDIGDDDEDDGLAAELEAAFEQEDDKDNNTVGLGIIREQQTTRIQDEEESEISEEE